MISNFIYDMSYDMIYDMVTTLNSMTMLILTILTSNLNLVLERQM